MFWENTYKHFKRLDDFVYGAMTSDVLQFDFCRRIPLGLTNHGHFGLVGLRAGAHGLESTSMSAIKVMAANRALEHLNLHFQLSPPYTRYLADPWIGADVSCQKTLVDWVLAAALAQMERVPKITLSGHVKHSTRRKWEAIFEDERRGIKHYTTVPMSRILSTPPTQL